MATAIRKRVSKKKRRYVEKKNGFDLDLSYITKNIIAMGFPSEGSEGIYRNPYSEVIRFLDTKHKDHYKVYNLCSERGYDPSKFYNRVEVFPFDDHNAPHFDLIRKFCENVHEWISQSEENIAVVHCKAGKGRTGLMICSWLLYNKEWTDPNDAMNFYAAMRTYNMKGVTIPSQIRYIRYFGQSVLNGDPVMRTYNLEKIAFSKPPLHIKASDIKFNVYNYKTPLFRFKKNKTEQKGENPTFDCEGTQVTGDIKVEVIEKTLTGSGNVLFTFWFCTGFIENNYIKLEQHELDKANKDRSNKVYPKGFYVELFFTPVESENGKLEDGQKENNNNHVNSSSSNSNHADKAPLSSELSSPKLNYKFSAITENTEPYSANDVAAGLLKDLIVLLAKNSGENFDVGQEQLAALRASPTEELTKINQAIADLKKVDLQSLKKQGEKLAFWLNLYHVLLIHSRIQSTANPPSSWDTWPIFARSRIYEIGGYTFSLLEVEQCILRNSLTPPVDGGKDYAITKFKKTDPRFKFALDKEELQLPCVMSYFTPTTPTLYIYDVDEIAKDIAERTRTFVVKHVKYTAETNELLVPEVFRLYAKDYGKKVQSIAKWLCEFLDAETKKKLSSNIKNVNVKFAEGDWTVTISLVHLYNIYANSLEEQDKSNDADDEEGDD